MSVTTDEHEQHSHGAISAAISNAVVRRTAEYTGRGPTKARTIIRDDVVLVVLQDTLTKGERALVTHDRAHKVLELRSEFQGAMGNDLTADIERLTGRKVIAFMSTNHIDPDFAAELFILEPAPPPSRQAASMATVACPPPDRVSHSQHVAWSCAPASRLALSASRKVRRADPTRQDAYPSRRDRNDILL